MARDTAARREREEADEGTDERAVGYGGEGPRQRVERDDALEARDEALVRDHPGALNENDRKTIADDVGYAENMTRDPDETFKAQYARSGRDLNPPSEKKKHSVGSALPEEEGHRG